MPSYPQLFTEINRVEDEQGERVAAILQGNFCYQTRRFNLLRQTFTPRGHRAAAHRSTTVKALRDTGGVPVWHIFVEPSTSVTTVITVLANNGRHQKPERASGDLTS